MPIYMPIYVYIYTYIYDSIRWFTYVYMHNYVIHAIRSTVSEAAALLIGSGLYLQCLALPHQSITRYVYACLVTDC